MPHSPFEPRDELGSKEQSPNLGRKFLTLMLTGFFACCGMMLLTVVDVIGRFFRHPIFGSVELVGFMATIGTVLYSHALAPSMAGPTT